ncbi:MAG TPA: hypothetical protein VMT09_13060 [Steroidobacteraceae bacterium]|nr:hypothetical protein [Steroidobacteraceae bacterium]
MATGQRSTPLGTPRTLRVVTGPGQGFEVAACVPVRAGERLW